MCACVSSRSVCAFPARTEFSSFFFDQCHCRSARYIAQWLEVLLDLYKRTHKHVHNSPLPLPTANIELYIHTQK